MGNVKLSDHRSISGMSQMGSCDAERRRHTDPLTGLTNQPVA